MANSIKNFFKPFLEKRNQSVLGIDIGSGSIKVVQLKRKKGKAILETYGELSLGPYAGVEVGRATKLGPDKLAEALNDVLKEANATTTNCAISIPMRSSMVSIIKIPEMDRKQMAKMVPIEARKYIPVPISEVTLDWFVIPKVEDEEEDVEGDEEKPKRIKQNEVLVVAIHNDVLNNYSKIVTDAKLDASFFEIEMFSTIRSVVTSGDNAPVMICDIGAGATKLYIVERGVVRDSHTIGKGSQDITMNISQSMGVSIEFAEKMKRNIGRNTPAQDKQIGEIVDLVLTPAFSEVNTVLLNYQKKYNRNVKNVILVGGGAMLEGIVEKANKQIGIEVIPGNPFSKLETPAFLEGVLQKTGLAFAPAIGLGIRKLQELG